MNEISNESNNVPLNPNLPLDPENFHQQKEASQKKESRCFHIALWIFQILTWIMFATFITVLLTLDQSNGPIFIAPLIIFIIVYITYIIMEQCSSTAKYLRNKSSNEGIYPKMSKYFSTPPKILFHCECYHYETTTYTSTDSEGNTTTETRTERVVTYSENLDFIYYSVRDVSGLFYLNCDDEATIRNKSYIKLELIEEINFADAITYMDYSVLKNDFCERNRNKDEYFDFVETRTIPGMIHHNLIKLRDSEPCTVNYCFFVFFTILTFAELYKPYVNSYCIEQKYKVRKIVSTRYDLNNPEYEQKYQNLNPKINLIEQKYDFQPQEYNYLNNEYSVNYPTEEELEEAEKFKDKIPEYTLSNKGIILDNVMQDNKNEIFNEEFYNNNENRNQADLPMIQMGQQGYQPPQS